MPSESHEPELPASDEADPEIQSTPAGMVEELEEAVEEDDATFD
jgi:hypothetical protein